MSRLILACDFSAYVSWKYSTRLDIFETEVTWFDALDSCFSSGRRLEHQLPTEVLRDSIVKQALLDKNRYVT